MTTTITSITTGSSGLVDLYAKWVAKDYIVTYTLYGGVNHTNNSSGFNKDSSEYLLWGPSRSGYTFEGEYDDTDSQVSSIPMGTTSDVTLTARWSIITYPITYYLNGGTNDTANPTSYTVESDTITLGSPTRVGYEFKGWSKVILTRGFNPEVSTISSGFTGDIILIANWLITHYTITYHLNGGSKNNNPTSFSRDDNTIILSNPIKDDYSFVGWYREETFDTNVTAIITNLKEELYAKCTWGDLIL